jgi:hypothetical protein
MRKIAFAVAALALAAAAAAAGAAPAPDTKQVHARGCVQIATEGRCLVLKDVNSGVLYNLLIKGAGPDAGSGIDFTGTLYDGATACMQGVPVRVTNWTRKEYLKCAKSRARTGQ